MSRELLTVLCFLAAVAPSAAQGMSPNLLIDPSFESSAEGWYALQSTGQGAVTTNVSFDGERAIEALADVNSIQEVAQDVAVVGGTTYTVTGHLRTSKIDSGTSGLWLRWLGSDGRQIRTDQIGLQLGTHTWKTLFGTLTAPNQAMTAQLILRSNPDGDGVGGAWFDALEFRGAPAQLQLVGLSEYLGGAQDDTLRDVFVDPAGNIYLTGGTESPNFPVTSGAYDTTLNTGGNEILDVFVTKLRPDGTIIWSTFIGGPNYDRAYALEVDDLGYVYVAGRAGTGFPTTPGALQRVFGGDNNPNQVYGLQDGFVLKLTPDGRQLVWSTYFGGSDRSFIRDIAIDSLGQVYLALASVTAPNPHITSGAFQTSLRGSEDGVIAKLSADGTQVLWATYLGGSGIDVGTPSIRVNTFGQAYVLGGTNSSDLPTTGGAWDPTYNGGFDMHLAKLNANGSQLLWGTYLGGSGVEFSETHGLGLDAQGNAVVAVTTLSNNFPTTPGAFQRTLAGLGGSGSGGGTNYPGDGAITKFNAVTGQLIASTYLGGSTGDGLEGINVATDGTVYVTGTSFSNNFPISANADQASNHGSGDMIAVKLSADLSTLMYGTYIGGSGADFCRASAVDAYGNLYAAGHTQSSNWPVHASFPNQAHGGEDGAFAKVSLAGFCSIAGAPCDDDNACTTNDVCNGQGSCAGSMTPQCEPCNIDGDCGDGVACTNDRCSAGRCLHQDACAADGNPCNGIETCSLALGSCVSPGDPCPGACQPTTGCPCQAPTVRAAGGRYLSMVLLPADSTVPVDIRVTSSTDVCLDLYAGPPVPLDINGDGIPDGGLALLVEDPDDRALLTPQQWGGTVFVTDERLIPSDRSGTSVLTTSYEVEIDCGDYNAIEAVNMPLWGDVNQNGFINVTDVQLTVLAFQRLFLTASGVSLLSTDLAGSVFCQTDQSVNTVDIQRVILAIQGQSYRAAVALYLPACTLCP